MHVVHIEDDSLLRDILKRSFKHAEIPIDLHQFVCGDDALPYIQERRQAIDLFILDIRLPGELNGIQIAQRLREIGCPGSIILTSAYYSSPDPNWLATLKVEYLPKPWYILEIMRKLEQYQLRKEQLESVTKEVPADIAAATPTASLPPLSLKQVQSILARSDEAIAPSTATLRHNRDELFEDLIDETQPHRPRDFGLHS